VTPLSMTSLIDLDVIADVDPVKGGAIARPQPLWRNGVFWKAKQMRAKRDGPQESTGWCSATGVGPISMPRKTSGLWGKLARRTRQAPSAFRVADGDRRTGHLPGEPLPRRLLLWMTLRPLAARRTAWPCPMSRHARNYAALLGALDVLTPVLTPEDVFARGPGAGGIGAPPCHAVNPRSPASSEQSSCSSSCMWDADVKTLKIVPCGGPEFCSVSSSCLCSPRPARLVGGDRLSHRAHSLGLARVQRGCRYSAPWLAYSGGGRGAGAGNRGARSRTFTMAEDEALARSWAVARRFNPEDIKGRPPAT